MTLLFSVDTRSLGLYNDPLFQSCWNIEGKHPLNVDEFFMYVLIVLKLV